MRHFCTLFDRPYLSELAACQQQIRALPAPMRSSLAGDRAVAPVGTLQRRLALAARAVVRKTAMLAVA
jgi:hypothetical protein